MSGRRRVIVHGANIDHNSWSYGGELTSCGRCRSRTKYVFYEFESDRRLIDCPACLRAYRRVHLKVELMASTHPCQAHAKAGRSTTNIKQVTCAKCLDLASSARWRRYVDPGDFGLRLFECTVCGALSDDAPAGTFAAHAHERGHGVLHTCTPEGSPTRGVTFYEYERDPSRWGEDPLGT